MFSLASTPDVPPPSGTVFLKMWRGAGWGTCGGGGARAFILLNIGDIQKRKKKRLLLTKTNLNKLNCPTLFILFTRWYVISVCTWLNIYNSFLFSVSRTVEFTHTHTHKDMCVHTLRQLHAKLKETFNFKVLMTDWFTHSIINLFNQLPKLIHLYIHPLS